MKFFRQIFAVVALSILGLTEIARAETPVVTTPIFGDDSYVHIPLQFGFPFYGRVFTHSWMHSNGVVSFFDPAVPAPGATYNPGAWAYCCQGEQPNTNTPQFSFMIAPLWTDLYPTHLSSFSTEGTSQYQRYFWNDISEISNMSNLNSFSLEIRPSGFIGVDYTKVQIQNQMVWIGAIGDPTQGQWNEVYYGLGIPGQSLNNWNIIDTGPVDQCLINPLYSTTCSGYTAAMCSSNTLYSPECPGYAQAYFNQQCNQNTLYDSACPGYAVAYYNYQCSVSALYHTGCPGYEVAYFNQQCGLNPLYNNRCPGYEVAYFNQQCSNDALYSNQCPGYGEAYAKKYILVTSDTVVTETVTPVEEVVTVVEQVDTVKEKVEVAVVVAEAPAASASPADKTSPVQLTAAPATSTTTTSTETKKESAPAANSPRPAASAARQALTQRRAAAQAASQQAAAQQASEKINSGEMSTDMDTSTSMEQQVEIQNVVMGAIGFVPGFDAYGKAFIPDAVGYRPFTIYNNQTNVDNARMMRGLTGSSDRLHELMVDQQYR
jgi:hypothetical protein